MWGAEPYPDYAAAVNDLGLLYRDKGDNDQSERLLRESLAMERRLLGDKHPELALALNNLALVQQRKGDLDAAESTFRQALAMQRELLGNVHPEVANTLNNLAFRARRPGRRCTARCRPKASHSRSIASSSPAIIPTSHAP